MRMSMCDVVLVVFSASGLLKKNVPVRACPALLLLARESGRGRGESCARRVPLTLEVEPRPGWMLIEACTVCVAC